ncbi:hypothetical protein Q2T42_21905 [Leptolyngbya boryana CZ1]|uniref:Uncharacterized protein n=1 Tax=Leptolyngbya boryana CZ1 TaxID=3060204 RepID=A0AA96WS49_LEPBY|nr:MULTISPECIES: hypothetical protein [Leptolyngbya]MBD1857965.1 hypothetical protein [Leptolyngbya sp. FACHB-1624]WNZ44458.1 hypothetical protein Q2T42_21905 [Leptolyngbya boryana CZ1]
MHELSEADELHTQSARDYAELAEHWAKKSRHYANSIDLPAAVGIAIAISVLITCLLITFHPGASCYAQR